jgi:hypothetical protein
MRKKSRCGEGKVVGTWPRSTKSWAGGHRRSQPSSPAAPYRTRRAVLPLTALRHPFTSRRELTVVLNQWAPRAFPYGVRTSPPTRPTWPSARVRDTSRKVDGDEVPGIAGVGTLPGNREPSVVANLVGLGRQRVDCRRRPPNRNF